FSDDRSCLARAPAAWQPPDRRASASAVFDRAAFGGFAVCRHCRRQERARKHASTQPLWYVPENENRFPGVEPHRDHARGPIQQTGPHSQPMPERRSAFVNPKTTYWCVVHLTVRCVSMMSGHTLAKNLRQWGLVFGSGLAGLALGMLLFGLYGVDRIFRALSAIPPAVVAVAFS